MRFITVRPPHFSLGLLPVTSSLYSSVAVNSNNFLEGSLHPHSSMPVLMWFPQPALSAVLFLTGETPSSSVRVWLRCHIPQPSQAKWDAPFVLGSGGLYSYYVYRTHCVDKGL